MRLEGSCHCGAVRFSVQSRQPYPYQRCYCSICRKAGGGGGFLINIAADATTLEVTGKDNLAVYRAMIERSEEPGRLVQSRHQRLFCQKCGCHLWAFNERWPELLHPVAGAIDTPLPAPPVLVHMMTGSKPNWVDPNPGPDDEVYERYPQRSLADWHRAHGLEDT